jgi:DNA-directed RNA polymerase specialized sigma24 family protein
MSTSSGAGYVIPVDPSELANRVHTPDFIEQLELLAERESEPEEDPNRDKTLEELLNEGNCEELLSPLLDRIPKREADLIALYYIGRKRQADIAAMFDVTQAAISYRLDRGLKRIKFLLDIPHVTEEELRQDLPRVFKDPIDVDILVGMWHTTCQSEVAERLGLTQGRVRHRFFKAVGVLKTASEKDRSLDRYYRVFGSISNKNFNVLREVKLPQWSSRGMDKLT